MIEDDLRQQGEAIGDEIMAGWRRFEAAVERAKETIRDADRAVGDLIFRVYQAGGEPKELNRHLAEIQAAEALVKYEKATVARFEREYRARAHSLIKKGAKARDIRRRIGELKQDISKDPKNPKAREWALIYSRQLRDLGDEAIVGETEAFIASLDAGDGNDRG